MYGSSSSPISRKPIEITLTVIGSAVSKVAQSQNHGNTACFYNLPTIFSVSLWAFVVSLPSCSSRLVHLHEVLRHPEIKVQTIHFIKMVHTNFFPHTGLELKTNDQVVGHLRFIWETNLAKLLAIRFARIYVDPNTINCTLSQYRYKSTDSHTSLCKNRNQFLQDTTTLLPLFWTNNGTKSPCRGPCDESEITSFLFPTANICNNA